MQSLGFRSFLKQCLKAYQQNLGKSEELSKRLSHDVYIFDLFINVIEHDSKQLKLKIHHIVKVEILKEKKNLLFQNITSIYTQKEKNT